MRRRLLPIATCVVAALAVTAATATDAAAAGPTLTPGASAYSAAASTGTGSLQASLQLTGSLGGLLDYLIDPIVNDGLNPLLSALQGSVDTVATQGLGASSGLTASTSPTQSQVATAPAPFPNDTLPSPCLSTGDQPCFAAASAAVNGAPLATIGAGALSGYVEQVQATADAANPVFGRAGVATPQVSVLPGITSLVPGLPKAVNPLVSAGLVNAKSNCPNDGAVGATKPTTPPSVNISTKGVTLLGGLVTFDVQAGQVVNLVVNGVSYPDLIHLPSVTVSGVTISPYGSNVLVAIPLTVDQVFAGLGLAQSVIDELSTLSPTSTVTLSLVVGPKSTVTYRTARAWGLGIGVNLSGALTFDLFGVVTARVAIPTGIGYGNYGNVLDLRLAYTSCESGIKQSSNGVYVPPIPPALV